MWGSSAALRIIPAVVLLATACQAAPTAAPTTAPAKPTEAPKPAPSPAASPAASPSPSPSPAAKPGAGPAASPAAAAPVGKPSGEPIKIGATLSITGNNAPLGIPERDTLLLLQDQINDRGGVAGRPLQVVILDDESKDDAAVANTKRLIQDERVLGVIGSSGSGPSLAMIPTAEESQTPLISLAAAIAIIDPPKKWVFKTPPTDVLFQQEFFDAWKEQGIKRLGLIHDTGGFGVTGRAVFEKLAKEQGFEVVAVESYEPTATDLKTQLTKIEAARAEAILNWGTGPGPVIFVKNARELDIKVPIFVSGGSVNQAFITNAGKDAEGVIASGGPPVVFDQLPEGHPQKAISAEFNRAYRERFNKDIDQFAAHAHDALLLFTNAIERAGPDKARIRDEIENTRGFVGMDGIFNMSPTDHLGLGKGAVVLLVVKDGAWRLLK